jgi:hypothetical protein
MARRAGLARPSLTGWIGCGLRNPVKVMFIAAAASALALNPELPFFAPTGRWAGVDRTGAAYRA